MVRMVLLATVLMMCGCSTVREVHATPQAVLQLHDYPPRDYRVIGTYEFKFFRPGMRSPQIYDVWPDLSEKVLAMGGNACVVRSTRGDNVWARTIWITCEVLSVSA